MPALDRTVAQIRARRMMALVTPRRRLPRQLQPDGVRLEYWKAIRARILEPAREALQVVLALVPAALASAEQERRSTRHDADEGKRLGDAIDRAAKDFAARLRPTAIEELARDVGQRTADFQKDQLERQIRAGIGVTIPIHENLGPSIRSFTAENVSLIRSIPRRYHEDVEHLVTRAVTNGVRWEDLAPQIEQRYGTADSRAKTIARDQVGKFYGRLNGERQQNLGVSGYIWRTVEDARVRDNHADLDGEPCAWNDPPMGGGTSEDEPGHPGSGINCRCFAEPDFSSLLAGADDE